MILVRLVQSENALGPSRVTLLGIVTPVRLLQPRNAAFPMLLSEAGSRTVPSPMHPQKPYEGIVEMPSPRVTVVRFVQSANTQEPHVVI